MALATIGQNTHSMQTSRTLCETTAHGDLESVQLLLKNKAPIDQKNEQGYASLHLAAKYGYTEIVELLIAHNATVNIQDQYNSTPLMLSMPFHSIKIAELLIANGTRLDAKNAYGNTALHITTFTKNERRIAEMLIDNNATIDIQNKLGQTPLHMAIQYSNMPLVKLLISHGAALDIQDQRGFAALTIALQERPQDAFIDHLSPGDSADLIKLLSYYYTLKTEVENNPQITSLIKIIHYGDYPELVHKLLASGIIPTQSNLKLAKNQDKKKIGLLLKNYLGIFGPQLTISKTGITQTTTAHQIPEEIVQIIAAYHSISK
jgi:Ankyrin repeats (3 copies)/Ankyrin repeats (many copies)